MIDHKTTSTVACRAKSPHCSSFFFKPQHTNGTLCLQMLTGSKGGSLGSKTEGEEERGEVAAVDISVHLLAVAAHEDMAKKSRNRYG